jgi:hypothetical protein
MGKCMDVNAWGTTNGTKVQLWHCNGYASQQWVYRSGELINPNSNMCLTANGSNIGWGTLLQIWTCAGFPNQLWKLP